jgi:hypothetical protein
MVEWPQCLLSQPSVMKLLRIARQIRVLLWHVLGHDDGYAWFVPYLEPAKTAQDYSGTRSVGVIRMMDNGK